MKKQRGRSATGVASIHQAVLAFVLSRRSSTCAEVKVVISPTISAARAAAAGRKRYKRSQHHKKTVTEIGRNKLVTDALLYLAAVGKIIRLRRATYGPPPPKIFKPAESA